MEQIVAVIQQASQLDWEQLFDNPDRPILDIGNLLPLNSMESDINLGICPFPLYQLTEKDWSIFQQKTDNDQIVEHLKKLGIYQYFYPAPDQALLGVNAFRPNIGVDGALRTVRSAPEIGHPFGDFELVDENIDFADLIPALEEQGYVVEGEAGLIISEKGKEVRQQIRFRPREGIIIRLLNALSANINVNL